MNPYDLTGSRLQEERKKLGLTQAGAAKKVGVRREMWGRYERGALPQRSVAASLSAAGFDVEYIFTGVSRAMRAQLNSQQACAIHSANAEPNTAQAQPLEPIPNTVSTKRIMAMLRLCTESECAALYTLLSAITQRRKKKTDLCIHI